MLKLDLNFPDVLLLKLDGSKERIKAESQKFLAIKFFELGYLTTGQAAEMCNINRVDFIQELSRLGIPVVRMEKEEIDSEIKTALSI